MLSMAVGNLQPKMYSLRPAHCPDYGRKNIGGYPDCGRNKIGGYLDCDRKNFIFFYKMIAAYLLRIKLDESKKYKNYS